MNECRRVTAVALLLAIIVVIVIVLHGIYSPFDNKLATNEGNSESNRIISKVDKIPILIKSKCICHRDQIILMNDGLSYTIEYGTLKYELNMKEFDLDASTCDLFSVLSRGPNQKVIGYTLFGNNTKYYKYLDLISEQAAFHYPGWTMRIYYDDSALQDHLCDFACGKTNVDLCYANQIPYGSVDSKTWSAMSINNQMWRWLPVGDPLVDYFMSRNVDSWIIEREAKATDEWLASNTLYHIMRDHPQHIIPMLRGMWGLAVVRDRLAAKRLFSKIIDKGKDERYLSGTAGFCCGSDQGFLSNEVWPEASQNSTIHDSYTCTKENFGDTRPFPTQRQMQSLCFVSCSSCCDTKLDKRPNQECPIKCRPKEHENWKYC